MEKRRSAEQIVSMLRQAEVMSGEGRTIAEITQSLGISDTTYNQLSREYGGMGVDQAKRMNELEEENGQLTRQVADLSLDNQRLRDSCLGKLPSAGQRRAWVARLRQMHGVSERRACRLLGVHRTLVRYKSKRSKDEVAPL